MKTNGKKICFLGDSITEGCGASAPEKNFVSLFAAAHPKTAVHNCGVGGPRIAPQKTPFSPACAHPFYSRVSAMPERADLVCVFGGPNDYGGGDAPMGKPGDRTESTFYGALYALSVSLLDTYPNGKIVFFTPLHRAGEEIPHEKPDGGKILKDYVRAIKENAEYFSFPVLDLWSVSGIQPAVPGMRGLFMPDGLHPNDNGYRRLFEIVDAFIENL